MRSRVVDDCRYCICCGKPATVTHHLIMGSGNRKKSDDYGLTIPLCAACHNMSENYTVCQIHDNPRAEDLSKMLGQAIWEKNYYKDLYYQLNRDEDEARDRFREIFGQAYL